MAYTQTTRTELNDVLAGKLGDPGKRFWSAAELALYITEALRAWQVHSLAYIQRIDVPTTPITPFYDLNLRPELESTVTDREIIETVERSLQEPVNTSGWSGTSMYSFEQISAAIVQRRNRFVLETGQMLQYLTYTPEVNQPNLTLRSTNIDIRWARWKDTDEYRHQLNQIDKLNAVAFAGGFDQTPGVPTDYIVAFNSPLALTFVPAPVAVGTLEVLVVDSYSNYDPTTRATSLGLFDDWTWVIKYGVLADMFSQDGPGLDPLRAEYCEKRWHDGITLARQSAMLFQGYINGVPTNINGLQDLDSFRPNWPNEVCATGQVPEELAVANNILVCAPLASPDTGVISVDALVNFPITQEAVQIGPEAQQAILDYAQHAALLKTGGDEFLASQRLLDNFFRLASVQNDRLAAQASSFQSTTQFQLSSTKRFPRRQSDTQVDMENSNGV